MTTPYTLQRKRADLLTRMRADTLGRTPFSETMAAMLANAPVDLNSSDSVILFLIQHFRPGEINATIDAAVSRAFEMRRDRASHHEIGASPAPMTPAGQGGPLQPRPAGVPHHDRSAAA